MSVVADSHETVAHTEFPRRTDGVRSVPAKLSPVMVTEPLPHVGVLGSIWKLTVGASKEKRLLALPTSPATVAHAMFDPTAGFEYVAIGRQPTVVLLVHAVVTHSASSSAEVGVRLRELKKFNPEIVTE